MTKEIKIPLEEQRQLLRLQLHQQRRLIAAQLEPKPVPAETYPRSMIMRFLTQQHGARLLGELAAVTIGTRWLRSAFPQTALKLVKSVMKSKTKSET